MDFVAVFLDKNINTPLYYQLYSYLRTAILAASIPARQKLPSKRSAASQLGVSVNTVDEAYQMLAAEGYIKAIPRSGFVVNQIEQLVPPPSIEPAPTLKSTYVLKEFSSKMTHSFSSGDIDISLFPHKMWNRLFKEVLAGGNFLFTKGEAFGDATLREAIASYLQGYRGGRCCAENIVVGAGLEVLVGMLVRLFPESAVAIENPGYPKTAQILQNEGVPMCAISTDEQGMCPAALAASKADIAYLTPSHHFPTGTVMPAGRRTALLQWAAKGSRLIIEDDYDSEFRFDGRPLPCMQGLDESGKVVYAGTFSRSLAPGLRAAYMVLPPNIFKRWQAAYGNYACTISRPEQHTLARFMAEGHFSRSLNRMRAAYKQRRDLLLAALKEHLPENSWEAQNTHTGLYFMLHIKKINALEFAKAAREGGLKLRAVDEYRFPSGGLAKSTTSNAVILGYGGLANHEISAAARAIAALL